MILPPFAAPKDFKCDLHPSDGVEASWFIFSGDRLLVSEDRQSLPNRHDFPLERTLYMGTFNSLHLFAGETDLDRSPPSGWIWSSLRSLYGVLDEGHYSIAGRAMQLIHWDRTNKYCGRCGSGTLSREKERCRECKSCGNLAYPKLAPAIMALVQRKEQILLARSPHFPGKFYSVLAGYVDPGETLEQCVAREVHEEVGVIVKNIRYFGSQPWPFSHSLMIGFTCEWEAGEIRIDPAEIEDAGWFDSTNLPELPPRLSLARLLIDSILQSETDA